MFVRRYGPGNKNTFFSKGQGKYVEYGRTDALQMRENRVSHSRETFMGLLRTWVRPGDPELKVSCFVSHTHRYYMKKLENISFMLCEKSFSARVFECN